MSPNMSAAQYDPYGYDPYYDQQYPPYPDPSHPAHPYNNPPQGHVPDYEDGEIDKHEQASKVLPINLSYKMAISILFGFGLICIGTGFFLGLFAFKPLLEFLDKAREVFS